MSSPARHTSARPIAPDGAFDRASAFHTRAVQLVADAVREIDAGWIVLTPSLPEVWSLNQLRLAKPLDFGAALELAEEHLSSLPYRHLVAESDELGEALAPALRLEGFRLEREVVMAMPGRSQRDSSHRQAAAVVEPSEQAMIELERRWLSEDPRTTPEGVEQLIEAARREGRAWGERRFGIRGDDGSLVAITKLRSDGRTAQVEDVYTAPDARGRGFATTLVAHAVRVAQTSGHELIFIVADDCDWPKHLYARLGFEPVGRRWAFHRPAG